jgi:Mce-associated membrane protein
MRGQRTPALLAGVLVLLLAAIAVTATARDDGRDELVAAAAPWRATAADDALTEAHKAVATAARAETLAFLAVDPRDMDAIAERVLAGATGEFARQYDASRGDLARQARRRGTVTSGRVVALGVAGLDADSAVVHVAADSAEERPGATTSARLRHHRLRLALVREGDDWLVSTLQFVG